MRCLKHLLFISAATKVSLSGKPWVLGVVVLFFGTTVELVAPATTDDVPTERAAWRYSQKDLTVTIVHTQGKMWAAERTDGKRPVYEEIKRTEEYVELQNRNSKLFIRLHAERAYWRRPKDKEWTPWVRGSWVAAPSQSAAGLRPGDHRVRLAYFVPRDRKPIPHYERKIRLVMAFVSELYASDLRSKGYKTDGIAFEMESEGPVVHLIQGDREASYYNNAPKYDANEQWRRLVPEIRAQVGDSKRKVIVVFSETYDGGPAEHLWPGVIARGAYYSANGGLAIYSAHLLRDEFCALTLQAQRRLFFDQTPIRGRRAWGHRMNSPRCEFVEDGFGAVAHELGHAFGLPHDRREDSRYLMGNGFRNLRWNFAARRGQRVGFSEENARLLMSSRYVAQGLDLSDDEPPQVAVAHLTRRRQEQTVSVELADDTGLKAIVFFDRGAGSIITGRELAGKSQKFRQRLPTTNAKSGAVKLLVIVTDHGGNQTRKAIGPSVAD